MTLSAIVLTRNEEQNIKDCLAALSWADEILVVDSDSTDRTISLAEKYGARVIEHPLKDFSDQRNFAMGQAKGDWVLFIDADERVTQELAGEIMAILNNNPRDLASGLPNSTSEVGSAVYAIHRHTYFFGKRLRFSDAKTDAPVRLFPKSAAHWTQPVHEKIITNLSVRTLKNPLLHYSTRNFDHYRQKVRDYVPLELRTMRGKGVKPALWRFLCIPLAKFFSLYFLSLGILDGVTGFQYAILSAYYTFEKYWRYWKEQRDQYAQV